MVPATFHPRVAEACVANKTHMVTASYTSPEMQRLGDSAKAAGVILLNEIGLDPGIDHLSAMKIIDEVRRKKGKVCVQPFVLD
jgi:alpha-aminoadipic semialdehyde synthase